jgi:hypothetical protein
MCEGYELEIEEHTVDDSTICVVIRYGYIQGGSNKTGTNCDLFTHKSSRSYLNHLVLNNHVNNVCDGPYTALFLV